MSDRQVRKLLRTQLLKQNPQALGTLLVELQDALEYRLELAKGDRGDLGPVGPIGPRGFQGESVRGERGFPGKDGKDGRDGYPGRDGEDGRDGQDGKNAEFDPEPLRQQLEQLSKKVDERLTVKDIIRAINELKGIERIDASAIKNLPLAQPTRFAKNPKKLDFDDLRWHGGGDGTSGGLTTIYTEIPAGLIDGVNVTYTVSHTIHSVINFSINGEYLAPSEYSFANKTITFNTPLDQIFANTPFYITYV